MHFCPVVFPPSSWQQNVSILQHQKQNHFSSSSSLPLFLSHSPSQGTFFFRCIYFLLVCVDLVVFTLLNAAIAAAAAACTLLPLQSAFSEEPTTKIARCLLRITAIATTGQNRRGLYFTYWSSPPHCVIGANLRPAITICCFFGLDVF